MRLTVLLERQNISFTSSFGLTDTLGEIWEMRTYRNWYLLNVALEIANCFTLPSAAFFSSDYLFVMGSLVRIGMVWWRGLEFVLFSTALFYCR